MHLLDLVMYFVLSGVLWYLLDKISYGDWTHELGGLIGCFIMIIYTIIYIILFTIYPDWNWSDFNIIELIKSLNIQL